MLLPWRSEKMGPLLQVKPPRGKPRAMLKRMAELSIAISPPSLKLRRALLAIHPRGKPRGILAKESKIAHFVKASIYAIKKLISKLFWTQWSIMIS
jgi:hypothetical protein